MVTKSNTVRNRINTKMSKIKHKVNQSILTAQDVWDTFKHEPADLGTFGGKKMNKNSHGRNPNVRNIELRRFDDIDKAGRFWKCMSLALLKENADHDFEVFKKMKNHDVRMVKKGDTYMIIAAEKGIRWGRKV